MFAPIFELEPGSGDEYRHWSRDEDLARRSRIGDPGGDVDPDPCDVRPPYFNLPCVKPYPDLEADVAQVERKLLATSGFDPSRRNATIPMRRPATYLFTFEFTFS